MDCRMPETVEPCGIDTEGYIAQSGVPPPVKKKKRGPSEGPVRLPDGHKRLVRTNRQGQPNLIDENTKALSSDIGLQVRELLPVAFEEFDKIPKTSVAKVLKVLEEIYNLSYVKAEWINKKMRKAWRDRKYYLRMKYIRGKTAAAIRAGETPDFVAIEDWHAFIEISTTAEFQAVSERNSTNRSKVEIPNGSGRHSMAQIRHMIAVEKGLASDDDVGRSEAYIRMLSKKRKPDHEKIAEMEDIMRRKPETRLTGPNDAVAQVFGEDTRKRIRTMGEAVSFNSLRDEEHLVNKLSDAEQRNLESESLVQKLSKDMVDFKQFVTNELMKTRKEKNVCSSQSASMPTSSMRTDQVATDVGKKCDIHAWSNIVVARGEVVEVDPKAIAHNVVIGEGNYKILVETVLDGGALLFRPNSQVQTIAEVCGGYAVWSRKSLTLYD